MHREVLCSCAHAEARRTRKVCAEESHVSKPHTDNESGKLPAFIVLPYHEDIATLAYDMYLQRGAADGFDGDDWLRAEQELHARGRVGSSRA